MDPAVNVVPHKQVIRVGRIPPNPKHLKQVVQLTVNVSNNCDGACHWLYIRLFDKNLPCLRRRKESQESTALAAGTAATGEVKYERLREEM